MLKLKRFEEPVWFEFQAGVSFFIKPLSKYDLVDIRLRSKRKMVLQGNSGREIIDDYDPVAVTLEIFKTILIDWKGIEIEGETKPTREAVIKGLFEVDEVREFIFKHAQIAFDSENSRLEEELKNSERSQSGL